MGAIPEYERFPSPRSWTDYPAAEVQKLLPMARRDLSSCLDAAKVYLTTRTSEWSCSEAISGLFMEPYFFTGGAPGGSSEMKKLQCSCGAVLSNSSSWQIHQHRHHLSGELDVEIVKHALPSLLPLGLRMVYIHDQDSRTVSVSVSMKLQQLLKKALWLSFWETEEVPTSAWVFTCTGRAHTGTKFRYTGISRTGPKNTVSFSLIA